MSLINQMLQELDARGTPAAGGGILQGQVRAVPERQNLHPAWWLVLVLAIALCAAAAWMWFERKSPPSAPQPPSAALPLKFATDLSRLPLPPAPLADAAPVQPATLMTQAERVEQTGLSEIASPQAKPAEAAAVVVDTVRPQPVAAPAPVAKPSANGISQPQVLPRTSAEAPSAAFAASAIKTPAAESATMPRADAGVSNAISKQYRESTPQQHAENDYRKATVLIQQGRTAEAINALERALQLDANNVAARQTLVALLIDTKRQDEAIRRLREGLHADASQSGLAMILARLMVERGELRPAIDTLHRSLPHAAEQADYQAFLAALLQRDGRHREAIEHYAQALRKTPHNGIWWMGMGISLQAEKRVADAVEAFTRAKSAAGLSPELKAFVEQRLSNLQ